MFFSSQKNIKIDRDLYHRLDMAAQKAGYSSTDELIRHVLEREIGGNNDQSDDEETKRQLRGLGYID